MSKIFDIAEANIEESNTEGDASFVYNPTLDGMILALTYLANGNSAKAATLIDQTMSLASFNDDISDLEQLNAAAHSVAKAALADAEDDEETAYTDEDESDDEETADTDEDDDGDDDGEPAPISASVRMKNTKAMMRNLAALK